MKKFLRGYFVPPFAGFFVVFCLQGLFGKSVNTWQQNIGIAFLFASVIALFIGLIYYYYDTKWGPRKRTNMLLKSPFTELQLQGFQIEENYCWGIIDGYTVFVSFSWHTGHSAIHVEVLFNPRLHGQFLTEEDRKSLHKRNKMSSYWKHAE